ncbi:uncharacterized protein LOC135498983 isoform X2 [Lineus longissimus]
MFRKRARNADEDCDDCMPISKRINRLQIGPESEGSFQQQDAAMQDAGGNDQQKAMSSWQQTTNNNYLPSEMREGQQGRPDVNNPSTSGVNPGPSYEMFNSGAGVMNAPLPVLEQNGGNCDIVCENYEPELDKNDNPHYFAVNEVLFNAHSSRLKRQRTGMNRSFPNS